MPTFRVSIRLLDGSFHGRGDGGEPEWPPSPLRVFQALVCAAAARWDAANFKSYARPALAWLEGLGSPTILAPRGRTATRPHRLYVPNNAGDLMVAAWARGNSDASMAEHRTEKDARPTRFTEGEPIHFDWSLTSVQHEQSRTHLAVLEAAARSITHLGWGVDMAVGNASILSADEAATLAGERWDATDDPVAVRLRVPVRGTLEDLVEKHEAFLGRVTSAGFKPVPPLRAFAVQGYRRSTDSASKPFAAFRIIAVDADGRPPSFDPVRFTRDVAAWVRNAVGKVCENWPVSLGCTDAIVHGHAPDGSQLKGEDADGRFMYLPLPSIELRGDRGAHVGSIRRVLIAAPNEARAQLEWVRQRLPGTELTALGHQTPGLLVEETGERWVLDQYVGTSQQWSTVTPVVLPGYDDPDQLRRRLREKPEASVQKRLLEQLEVRIEGLLRKALKQAGLPNDATIAWRDVGFRPGVGLARNYVRPEKLDRFSAYHVRIQFQHEVRGPLAIGAGRYRGFGVFAKD